MSSERWDYQTDFAAERTCAWIDVFGTKDCSRICKTSDSVSGACDIYDTLSGYSFGLSVIHLTNAEFFQDYSEIEKNVGSYLFNSRLWFSVLIQIHIYGQHDKR